MSWMCSLCGASNDDQYVRCSCGFSETDMQSSGAESAISHPPTPETRETERLGKLSGPEVVLVPVNRKVWRHRVAGIFLAIQALLLGGAAGEKLYFDPAPLLILALVLLFLCAASAFCGTRWKFVRAVAFIAFLIPILDFFFIPRAERVQGEVIVMLLLAFALAAAATVLLKETDFVKGPTAAVRETKIVAWFAFLSGCLGILLHIVTFFANTGSSSSTSTALLFGFVCNTALIVGATGILRRRVWGRYLTVASVVASACFFLSPLAISGLLINLLWLMVLAFVLFNRQAKLYYEVHQSTGAGTIDSAIGTQ
jgi:hypothetical protein